MRPINIFSAFDGISCGQIALERAGVPVKNYFSSEIDKYAIKVTQANYSNTVQVGNIRNVRECDFPKIDLLIGGSPCQGFSFAGKQANFKDPHSVLFFEFVRLLKEMKPKYFLLENVRMRKEWQDVISRYVGCEPIEINSALVSAQNRRRLYWTNIPNIAQPKDQEIFLRDIIEYGCVDKDKSYCIDTTLHKENVKSMFKRKKMGLIVGESYDDIPNVQVSCGAFRGRYIVNEKRADRSGVSCAGKTEQRLEIRDDCKTNTMTTVQKDNVIVYQVCKDVNMNDIYYRKLTPTECARLQNVREDYLDCVSNSRKYQLLGNGWTVNVVSHILNNKELRNAH